ncbi:MAG: DNA alkylation repair protein [Methanothrix sp.]|nr:DNA alkylation repair protein [Methanothrix sp.]
MEMDVLAVVRQELLQSIDEKTRESAQRFFKEEVKFHGVKSALVKKIATLYFREIKDRDKNEIFSLCENLLQANFGEEAFIAFEWSYSLRRKYEPEDFAVFERWVAKYVDNWAKCDTLCNHTLGSFVEMYPQFIENLAVWASSENRWLRRASAVTLILPARRGLFLKEVFEISDILLTDKDDMVQKGYGWLLKEASKKHEEEVFDYVMRWKVKMPRTALRYAIEKMPEEMRKKAMER